MKTKTTQTTKIGENTNTRNFFQKTFILLAILAFTSFGFKAKAQSYTVTVNNNTIGTCSWRVLILDNSNVIIDSIISTASSILYNPTGCNANIASIVISDMSGNCQGYTFGSGGSFPYTAVIPQCSFPKVSCSSGINCQGVTSLPSCGSTPPIGSTVVTININ